MSKYLPPWGFDVTQLPSGQWQASIVITEPARTEAGAQALARFLLAHMDVRLPDVGRRLEEEAAPPKPRAPRVPFRIAP